MTYLQNTWYPAAWASEVNSDTLLGRQLLGESVLVFRDEYGVAQAVSNRCPHRFAPLHTGKKVDGAVQCPYHGLRFNGSGQCIHSPQGPIPKAAVLRSFPLVEKYSALWIWMGNAELADERRIPDFSCMDPDTSFVAKRYLRVNANYVLETDNIMDLSHIQFLHPGTLGSDAISSAKTSVEQIDNTVFSNRETRADTLPDFLYKQRRIPQGSLVDRWIDVRWDAPASMLLKAGSVATGQPRANGVENDIVHLFTPETETTTHYWFAVCNPKSLGAQAEGWAEDFVTGLEYPFRNEDLPMLEHQQQMIGDRDFWSLKPVLMAGDAGAVRARRVLDKLIAAEKAGE